MTMNTNWPENDQPPEENLIPPAQWEKPGPTVWGGWATLGFSLLIGVIIIMAEGIMATAYMFSAYSMEMFQDPEAFTNALLADGTFILLTMLIQAVVGIGMVLVFVKIKSNATIGDYLGVHRISWRTFGITVLLTAALLVLISLVDTFLGTPQETDYITEALVNTMGPALLIIIVAILAPLSEEIMFRGFMFAGWSRSRLGVKATVVITALLWSAMHIQYSWWGISQIFLMGIVLGLLRYRTGSIWPCIIMHALWNLLAATQFIFV